MTFIYVNKLIIHYFHYYAFPRKKKENYHAAGNMKIILQSLSS